MAGGVDIVQLRQKEMEAADELAALEVFADACKRHGKLLIIWDGLGVHKSRLVREFIESLKGQIEVEFLPAYAPELNPAEYIWGHLKQHEIGNLCVKNLAELSPFARNRLRSMQRRPRLIAAFWVQAELAF